MTGWRLGDAATRGGVIFVLTFLFVGLSAAATVALFDRALARYPRLDRRWQTLLTVGLGAGTLLASFAGTFNNHVPAAALLFAALLAAFDGRALAAGAAIGLSGGIDLLPGFGFAPIVAVIAVRAAVDRRRAVRRFAGGFALALALFVGGNVATTGSPLPPKMVPGAVDLSATAGESVAGVVLPEGKLYALELLAGSHGLFGVSPILVFGAIGLLFALRRPPFGDRPAWILIAAGMAAQWLGHALLAGSYGGWSYGYRYLLPIQPVLLLAAPLVFERAAARAAFAAVLPVSILFAALGAYHPWPPAYEQASTGESIAATVSNPIGGNAAAWCAEHLPSSSLTETLGSRFVAADPETRRRYFAIFFASKGDFVNLKRFAG